MSTERPVAGKIDTGGAKIVWSSWNKNYYFTQRRQAAKKSFLFEAVAKPAKCKDNEDAALQGEFS
ncbi:MAG: hypothetical protein RBT34_05910 [Anaerolineaceae bacterium]|jgi:hypothetical protein|nr:hypothetical protein [Anaerolineaceae bacterium]